MRTRLYAEIESAARLIGLLAAFMAAAVCSRFAVLVIADAFSKPEANARAGQTAEKSLGELVKESEKPANEPFPADTVSNSKASGATLRVGISVTVRGPRSSVYVNGASRGRTPFIGDLECNKGDPIRIELTPEDGRGVTRVIERKCDSEIIYVRE